MRTLSLAGINRHFYSTSVRNIDSQSSERMARTIAVRKIRLIRATLDGHSRRDQQQSCGRLRFPIIKLSLFAVLKFFFLTEHLRARIPARSRDRGQSVVYGRIPDSVSRGWRSPCKSHARQRRCTTPRLNLRHKRRIARGHLSGLPSLRSGTFLLFYPNSFLSFRHTARHRRLIYVPPLSPPPHTRPE